jgi:hypothetical protein
MSRNVTVHLDDDTIHKAKVLAARRATSLSKLVGEIERLVGEDDTYQQSLQTALHHLEHGFHLGGGSLPDRSSLHDR